MMPAGEPTAKLTNAVEWRNVAAEYASGMGFVPWDEVPAQFVYNATVLNWHDGDTVNVDVDYGFHRHDTPVPIRLLGCNAAELAAPGGKEARDAVSALVPPGTRIVLMTATPDKYAPRIDAAITYIVDGQPHDLVTDLIALQWVAPWDGTGKQPVPPWPRTVA